jgi:RNA polymerase sigma-70 factor (ECF subfamily)
MSQDLETGLKQIEQVGAAGGLDNYHLYHAARADILRRLRRKAEAARAYEEALLLATNNVEQEYLKKRLRELKQ